MKSCKSFYCGTVEPLPLREVTTPFGMFTDLSARTLYVPNAEAVKRYKVAPVWREFGKIVAYLGDVNGDGKVTYVDAALVYAHFNGKHTLPAERLAAADVNGDGKVTYVDAALIYARFNGKITGFPAEQK